MKKNVAWKDKQITDIARFLIGHNPEIVSKIKSGALKVHGIDAAVSVAQIAVLSVDMRKNKATAPDIAKIKAKCSTLRVATLKASVPKPSKAAVTKAIDCSLFKHEISFTPNVAVPSSVKSNLTLSKTQPIAVGRAANIRSVAMNYSNNKPFNVWVTELENGKRFPVGSMSVRQFLFDKENNDEIVGLRRVSGILSSDPLNFTREVCVAN